MSGTVIAVNVRRGMFVVQVPDYGDYYVFELLDSVDIEVGAQVRGDLTFLGGGDVFYVPAGRNIHVYGQSGSATKSHALRLIA